MKNKSIWPLPGGSNNYVKTAFNIVKTVNNKKYSRECLKNWLNKEYNLSGGASEGYINVLVYSLHFLDYNGPNVSVTETGKEFLQNQNSELVLKSLKEHVLGFEEIISLLSFTKKIAIHEIYEKLNDELSVNQIKWRINWLRSLGLVKKERKKYLLIKKN